MLGFVHILGGLFLAVSATDLTGHHDQPYYPGLVGIAAGVVATPIGWLMFDANGRPGLEVYLTRNAVTEATSTTRC